MAADTAISYCDISREESDSRYDRFGASFDPEPSLWAPDCGHAVCKEDHESCPEPSGWHDWDCPVAACRLSTLAASCGLVEGHGGLHQFDAVDEPEPSERYRQMRDHLNACTVCDIREQTFTLCSWWDRLGYGAEPAASGQPAGAGAL